MKEFNILGQLGNPDQRPAKVKRKIFVKLFKLGERVEVTFSHEKDEASFFLNKECNLKYNGKINGFVLGSDKKSVDKLNSSLTKFALTMTNFDDKYEICSSIANEDLPEINLFGTEDLPEEKTKKEKKSKKEKIIESFEDMEDEEIYHILNEKRKALSNRQQKRSRLENNNIITLEDQEETFKESIETRMARILKEEYLVDFNGKLIRFRDSRYNTYSITTEDEIKAVIKLKIEESGFSKYVNKNGANKVYESILMDSVLENDRRKIVNFSEKHFSLSIKTGTNRLIHTTMSLEFDETGEPFFKLQRPEDVNNCKYRINNVYLDMDKVTDRNGNKAFDIDFNEEDYYVYNPKFDESCELNQYLFDGMYDTKEMKEAAQIIEGSFFSNKHLQRSMFYVGHGGDGKSVRQRLIQETYDSLFYDKANIVMQTVDGFNNYNGFRFPIWGVPEIDKNDNKINFLFFKKLIGADNIEFKIKYRNDSFSYRFNKIMVVVNANYNQLPTISSDDIAVIRRMCFIKVNKPKRYEPNLTDLLIHGGTLNNIQYSDQPIEIKGNVMQDMLEFHLEGALKLERMRGFKFEDLGSSVLDFQKEMIEKMSNGADFFEYYDLQESEEFGILGEDILAEFKLFKNNNNYNKKRFLDELSSCYERKFGRSIKKKSIWIKHAKEDGTTGRRKGTIYFVNFTGLVGVFNKYREDETITESLEEARNNSNIVEFKQKNEEDSSKTTKGTKNKKAIF